MLYEVITPDTPGCLVLDIRMPGMGGLDLQAQLVQEGVKLPIIFLTRITSYNVCYTKLLRVGGLTFYVLLKTKRKGGRAWIWEKSS